MRSCARYGGRRRKQARGKFASSWGKSEGLPDICEPQASPELPGNLPAGKLGPASTPGPGHGSPSGVGATPTVIGAASQI